MSHDKTADLNRATLMWNAELVRLQRPLLDREADTGLSIESLINYLKGTVKT